MGDYIITYDENGQAYIEHAFWNRKGQTKKNHKYLLKIGEGVKARYFYTKAEVDAYYKNKTGLTKKSQLEEEKKDLRKAEKKAERDEMKAIKAKRGVIYDSNGNEWYTNMNAANKAYDADLEATRSANAVKEAKRRVNVAQGMYDNTPSGKAEKAISNVKSKAERIKEEFRNKKETTVETIKDKAGIDELERRQAAIGDEIDKHLKYAAAKDEYDKAVSDYKEVTKNPLMSLFQPKKYKKAVEELNNAKDKYHVAKRDYEYAKVKTSVTSALYDKTPLGVIDNVMLNTGHAIEELGDVGDTALKVIKKTGNNIKDKNEQKKKEKLDKARDEFIDKINIQMLPFYEMYNKDSEVLKKTKKVVYNADTNEYVNAYDRLVELGEKRNDLMKPYLEVTDNASRKDYEQQVQKITDEMADIMRDLMD